MTGAQDCHSGTVEIGSDVPLKEIGEGDEGEAISSRRRLGALISVWSMRSLLDTENQEAQRGGGEGRGGACESKTGSLYKVSNWGPPELDPCLTSVGAKGAESSVKDRQIRRPFHPDYCFLRKIHYTAACSFHHQRRFLQSSSLLTLLPSTRGHPPNEVS